MGLSNTTIASSVGAAGFAGCYWVMKLIMPNEPSLLIGAVATVSVFFVLLSGYFWSMAGLEWWSLHSKHAKTRIPLIAVLKQAEKSGWSFLGDSNEIYTFAASLREAASNREVQLWGRRNESADIQLNRHRPLLAIPADHWRELPIDPSSLVIYNSPDDIILSLQPENLFVRSYAGTRPRAMGFVDLHVIRGQAMKWLNQLPSGV